MNRLTKRLNDDVTLNKLQEQCINKLSNYGINSKFNVPKNSNWNIEVENKLGTLEDIEEELGIDLITLFKALKDGIWIKNDISSTEYEISKAYIYELENPIYTYEKRFYAFMGIKYCFNWRDDIIVTDEKYIRNYKSYHLYRRSFATNLYGEKALWFKDYGKTWALTKEELEGK